MQGISYNQYLILWYLTKFKKIKLNKNSLNCKFLLNNGYLKNIYNYEGQNELGETLSTPTNYFEITNEGINVFFNYRYNRLPRTLSIISLIISMLAFFISLKTTSL